MDAFAVISAAIASSNSSGLAGARIDAIQLTGQTSFDIPDYPVKLIQYYGYTEQEYLWFFIGVGTAVTIMLPTDSTGYSGGEWTITMPTATSIAYTYAPPQNARVWLLGVGNAGT